MPHSGMRRIGVVFAVAALTAMSGVAASGLAHAATSGTLSL